MSTTELKLPMLVDGAPRWNGDTGSQDLIDPSTGERLGVAALASAQDIDDAVAAAKRAYYDHWRDSQPADRGRLLLRIAEGIRAHADELAALTMRNTGYPRGFATTDAENAARYFEFYAGLADKIHGETIPLGPERLNYTVREPYGVCGVITPFNGPVQLVGRSAAPALAAGNTVVLKPTEIAPGPALALAQLLPEFGVPAGVINIVAGAADAGQRLIRHPDVHHITFTGSVETGAAVMRAAADTITPVTLELGGKSPQVIFEDADLDAAIAAIRNSALISAGQVCSAGTRLVVHEAVRDDFVERLKAASEEIDVGRPVDGAAMGPVISAAQHDRVLNAIRTAQSDGAKLVTGGADPVESAPARGFFVKPTVFDEVAMDTDLWCNEVFGPVLAVSTFKDWSDALRIANDTDFGLCAGVWTQDMARALHFARNIEAGQVFLNNYGSVEGSGIELPFGGYKQSGIGREKGVLGLDEYTQVKNVCVLVEGR